MSSGSSNAPTRNLFVEKDKLPILMGDVVTDEVDLAELQGIGKFELGGNLWPTVNGKIPGCVQRVKDFFQSEEHFVTNVLKPRSEWPEETVPIRLTKDYDKHMKTLEDARVVQKVDVGHCKDVFGNYFAVSKGDGYSRAIFALLRLNEISKDPPKFEGFSVQKLLQCFSRLKGQPFVVLADFRNYYYQLRLPKWLRPWMAIKLSEEEACLCRVMAMGWSPACWAAQSLSYGVVAHKRTKQSDLGFDAQTIEEITPGIVWFKNDVGFIAVIYDTILVVVNSEELASQWKKRIDRNSEAMNILLKYCHRGTNDLSADEQSKGGISARFNFSGVDFEVRRGQLYWRVAQSTFDTWKMAIQAKLNRTPKAFWSGMGYLRRHAEVTQRPRRAFAQLAQYQASLSARSPQQDPRFWRAEIVDADMIQALQTQILSLQNNWLRYGSHIPDPFDPLLVAVDATPLRTGYAVIKAATGNIAENRGEDAENMENVNEAEALAIRRALDALEPVYGRRKLFVIASDNQAAATAWARGYPKDSEAMRRCMRTTSVNLLIVDIPSEENFADMATRPDKTFSLEDFEHRRKATWRRLLEAVESYKAWPVDFIWRQQIPSMNQPSSFEPEGNDGFALPADLHLVDGSH